MPPDDASVRSAAEALVQDKPPPASPGPLSAPAQTERQPALKILILEDEPADAKLMQRELRKAKLDFTARRVDTRDAFVEALETFAPDVLLADYNLPGFSGAEALAHMRHVHPEIPVVIVTGALGDEAAIDLLNAGAKDYVLKSNLLRLPSAVERAIAVEQGIRARKSAEQAFRRSEEKFRSLVETTSDWIWELDAHGAFTYSSPQAQELLGYDPAELVGKSVLSLLTDADRVKLAPVLQRLIADAAKFSLIEARCLHRDGREITIELSGNPVLAADATLARFRGIARDITERKEAAAALALSEERHRTLVLATSQVVWTTDAQGKVLDDSPGWRAFTGLTIEEIKGDGWAAALHPDDLKPTMDVWLRAVDARTLYDTEFRVRRHDGKYRHMAARGVPVLKEDGTVREWIGTCTDITERKRAADTIRESEAKFRSLVEQNVAGIVIIRHDGTIGYLNPFFARMLGCAASDLIGRPLLDIIPEDEKAAVREKLGAQLSADAQYVRHNLTIPTRDGRPIDLIVNASRSIFEGRPASLAVVLDVTESNKAQRELASTAAILATEHELSPDGILVVDQAAQIISTNRRFAEIFGVSAQLLADKADEHLLQSVVAQVVDGAAFLSRVRYLYDHTEETSFEELALKDGRVLDRYSAPMKRTDGEYAGRVWFFRDITDRKRAEEDLRTTEGRFRLVVEHAPDAILLYDVDQNHLISANKAAERLFGLPRERIVQYGPQHFYVPEQPDAQPVAQSFDKNSNRALAGEEVTFERRIRNALGQERLCQVTLVRMPSASLLLLRASFIDITDQKAAERALRRLNRTLRTLSRGNEVLVRATSEPELLNDMCRVIVETGGYRMAWIGVPQQDAAKSVTPVASAGEIGQYLEKARITWADEPHGDGPYGRAIRSGEPQITQNLAADPSMAPWLEAAKECGFASAVVLPLKDGSAVFAVLAIHSAETDAFDPEELKLLRELAEDLAFGIRSLREHTAHEELDRRWRASLEATVGAIANTVEMRDPYTSGHQQRVAGLAVAIARELALPEQEIQGLYLAGIVHDVGKIDIPAEILNKPGKLSKLQFQLIQAHAEAGYDIVKGVDFPWPIAEIVRQHHERLDGSGYPHGLRAEAILPEAKILAVADVVEAMMSHRPYRASLGIEAALAEIENGKGTLYDPAVVEACTALLGQNGFSFE